MQGQSMLHQLHQLYRVQACPASGDTGHNILTHVSQLPSGLHLLPVAILLPTDFHQVFWVTGGRLGGGSQSQLDTESFLYKEKPRGFSSTMPAFFGWGTTDQRDWMSLLQTGDHLAASLPFFWMSEALTPAQS